MNIDTRDMIKVSDINSRGVSSVINEAAEGRRWVVVRGSKPVVAIVDIETMDRLQELEEREEDLRLFALAATRMATDNGRRTSLHDVAAKLGINLDELRDDEDDEG